MSAQHPTLTVKADALPLRLKERNRSRGRALRARTTASSRPQANQLRLWMLSDHNAFPDRLDPFICVHMILRSDRFKQTICIAQHPARCSCSVHISHSFHAAAARRPLCVPQLEGDQVSLTERVTLWNLKPSKNRFPLSTQDPCRHATVVPVSRKAPQTARASRHANCRSLPSMMQFGAASP